MTITELEIYPIKDLGDSAMLAESDDDADYFSLFGRVDGEVNDFYICVGDFASRDAAELTKELLDNKKQGLPQQ